MYNENNYSSILLWIILIQAHVVKTNFRGNNNLTEGIGKIL